MSSIKCKSCNLSNFVTDVECRRCRRPLHSQDRRSGPPASPRRFSFVSIIIFAAIAVGVFYMFSAARKSVSQVGANEANRVAVEAERQQAAGLSRAEEDRQRAQRVGNFVNISPALAEHKKATEERQKMIEQSTNSSPR